MVVGQVDKTHSTRKEFQEFGDLVEGRWLGEVLLVYNWPGREKEKGDTITAYNTFKWVADKNGIDWEGFGGNTTGKTLIVWDAPSKRIITQHVGSAGGTWRTVIWKTTPEKWGWRFLGGGLADGREFNGEGEWIFSEDGKELSIVGDISVGTEKLELDRAENHYHRVNK